MSLKTFKIDTERGVIGGFAAGLDLVRQNCQMRLLVERGLYPIFPAEYGSRLHTLIGGTAAAAAGQIESMVREALLEEESLQAVQSVSYEDGRVTARVLAAEGPFTASIAAATDFERSNL